jgi:hypothetical protein
MEIRVWVEDSGDAPELTFKEMHAIGADIAEMLSTKHDTIPFDWEVSE